MGDRFPPPAGRSCKWYSPHTDAVEEHHSEVLNAADSPDYDPSWLGSTVNEHQWGYCKNCGQPFQWRVDLFQWVDVTKEQVHEAYLESVAWIKEKAMSFLDPDDANL